MRVLATHSIRQFPLHFPSRASPCATRFRTSSTTSDVRSVDIMMLLMTGTKLKTRRWVAYNNMAIQSLMNNISLVSNYVCVTWSASDHVTQTYEYDAVSLGVRHPLHWAECPGLVGRSGVRILVRPRDF